MVEKGQKYLILRLIFLNHIHKFKRICSRNMIRCYHPISVVECTINFLLSNTKIFGLIPLDFPKAESIKWKRRWFYKLLAPCNRLNSKLGLGFEIGDVFSTPPMFNYIAVIFIPYALTHFFGDFSLLNRSQNDLKMVQKYLILRLISTNNLHN